MKSSWFEVDIHTLECVKVVGWLLLPFFLPKKELELSKKQAVALPRLNTGAIQRKKTVAHPF